MTDEREESSGAIPLDRGQWEEYFARWQEAEARFSSDPAEGVRVAARLIVELTGISGASSNQVVRQLTWKRQYALGDVLPVNDPNPLAALADLGRGISEAVQLAKNAQAAARGMSAAREHRHTSVEDFQLAMGVYRDVCARLLGIQVKDLLASRPGDERHDDGTVTPGGHFSAGVTDAAIRERIIAEKLVREAMIPYEQAEVRADRRRTVRWAVYQFAASLVVGLLVLAVVIWVLSQQ